MGSKRIVVTVVGAIILVILTYTAWTEIQPIRDAEPRVFWLSVVGLALLLVFNLFMPGWLVVLLIASTLTVAWTVYIREKYPNNSMSSIGSFLIFVCSIAGGAAVLWLIDAVKSAVRKIRRKPLTD